MATDFKMENLKKLREKKKLTQTKVGIDVGLSQEVISHFEIGNSKPNIDNLIKLADYFNCSTDYLLGRTDIPEVIRNINNQDIIINEIINKYNSLSDENKKYFIKFLDFLIDN